MASALASLANATVTLTVPAAGTVVDAVTGNVLPVTTTVTYSLFVRAVSTSTQELPGINTSSTVYEGYCVNPQTLDSKIIEGTFGTVNFSGQGSYECQVLKARFDYGATGVLGQALQGALGDRIRLLQLRPA